MSGPTPNPSGCCGMIVSCCGTPAPDVAVAQVTALCGTFSGTLYGQGSGGNSGCWTGSVAMQLKNLAFPPVCANKTLGITMCCQPGGNMLLTVDCGGAGSGTATLPPPARNPMDLIFTNLPRPHNVLFIEI